MGSPIRRPARVWDRGRVGPPRARHVRDRHLRSPRGPPVRRAAGDREALDSGRASFEGDHYTLRDAVANPKPVQSPPTGLDRRVGSDDAASGGSARRRLELGWESFADAVAAGSQLASACRQVDRDPEDIRWSAQLAFDGGPPRPARRGAAAVAQRRVHGAGRLGRGTRSGAGGGGRGRADPSSHPVTPMEQRWRNVNGIQSSERGRGQRVRRIDRPRHGWSVASRWGMEGS